MGPLTIDSRVIAWASPPASSENSFSPYLVVVFHISYLVCMSVCVCKVTL